MMPKLSLTPKIFVASIEALVKGIVQVTRCRWISGMKTVLRFYVEYATKIGLKSNRDFLRYFNAPTPPPSAAEKLA